MTERISLCVIGLRSLYDVHSDESAYAVLVFVFVLFLVALIDHIAPRIILTCPKFVNFPLTIGLFAFAVAP